MCGLIKLHWSNKVSYEMAHPRFYAIKGLVAIDVDIQEAMVGPLPDNSFTLILSLIGGFFIVLVA